MLRHLDHWNRQRAWHAAAYDNLLGPLTGGITAKLGGWGEHVFHQYTVRVAQRDTAEQALAGLGISRRAYYPVPLHLHPAYARLGYKPGSLLESEEASAEVLSLPVYPELSEKHLAYVAESISEVLAG